MTVQKGEQYSKRVDFVAKDEDEQVATGIVMVPNKVDLQGDFAREPTIRQFAEQFGALESVGQADGGVMHAVWPSEWMTLERNEILDEAAEIGGVTAPAGAWIQSWGFDDDELWSLVNDGVLEGYSIGAINVDWSGPMDEDGLPDDVDVADDYDGDMGYWEIADGLVREVSAVDIPAVPDAMILETKADADKRLADHLGNRDGFIEEATERGHSEAEARRLWDLLDRAVDVEGAGEPGKQSVFHRAGKAFLSVLSGSNGDADKSSQHPAGTDKEGRTLSTANRDSLFATIDSSLDVLEDAGVDHGMTRFTDRDDVGFSLTEHDARDWSSDEDDGTDVSPVNNAAGGDTPGDDGGTEAADDSMSNGDTEPPEWAKDLQEQIDEQSKRLDEALDGDGDGGKDAAWEDAPEWAKSLKEDVDKQADRIDEISKQTGATESQQLGGTEKGGDGDEGGLDDRQKFFIPESKRGGRR